MLNLEEHKLTSTLIYDGKVIHLFRDQIALPNGNIATREVIRHQGAVAIVPLTDKNEVVMVRQFRYPFSRVMLEIPAGKLDSGESPDDCAARELFEETGASADTMTYLGVFCPTVAYSDEVIHLYLAKCLTFGEMHTDEDEFLNVERIPLQVLVDQIMSGTIEDGKTQAAILKTWFLLQQA
ncbi:MAG: NUDIX hydrolase [Clostridia bacterium]